MSLRHAFLAAAGIALAAAAFATAAGPSTQPTILPAPATTGPTTVPSTQASGGLLAEILRTVELAQTAHRMPPPPLAPPPA